MGSPVDIDNTEGDIIGTSVSGSGHTIRKNSKVEVQGDYIVINNPSKEAITALEDFRKVPTGISSSEKRI
jgi:hypothetical protein